MFMHQHNHCSGGNKNYYWVMPEYPLRAFWIEGGQCCGREQQKKKAKTLELACLDCPKKQKNAYEKCKCHSQSRSSKQPERDRENRHRNQWPNWLSRRVVAPKCYRDPGK